MDVLVELLRTLRVSYQLLFRRECGEKNSLFLIGQLKTPACLLEAILHLLFVSVSRVKENHFNNNLIIIIMIIVKI